MTSMGFRYRGATKYGFEEEEYKSNGYNTAKNFRCNYYTDQDKF